MWLCVLLPLLGPFCFGNTGLLFMLWILNDLLRYLTQMLMISLTYSHSLSYVMM